MDSERDGCGGSIFRKRSGAGHHGNVDDAFGLDCGRHACGNSIRSGNECTRRSSSAADFYDHVSRGLAADGFNTSKCGGCSARTNRGNCQRMGTGHTFAGQRFANYVDSGRGAADEGLHLGGKELRRSNAAECGPSLGRESAGAAIDAATDFRFFFFSALCLPGSRT